MHKRSMFFVDGFNLYHSLNAPDFRKYKWLNLFELARNFSHPPYEELQQVKYFTAYATWRKEDSVSRHRAYVKALQSVGVDVVLGRFQEKERKCTAPSGCGKKFTMHEEKLTDVNIAVSIVESCLMNRCDILYLVSGDNDLVPALQTAKRLCDHLKVTVILPPNAKAKILTQTCHQNGYAIAKINEQFLVSSQFPDQITVDGKIYTRPVSWK